MMNESRVHADHENSGDDDDDHDDEKEEFFDSMEDFSFYDCVEEFSDDPFESDDDSGSVTVIEPLLEERILPQASLRRRRKKSFKPPPDGDRIESSTSNFSDEIKGNIIENGLSHSLDQGQENAVHVVNDEPSVVTDANDNSGNGVGQNPQDGADTSVLFVLAGLLVKAISFQIHYFVKIVFFPIRFMLSLYAIVSDPFGFFDRCKDYLIQRMREVCIFAFGSFSSSLDKWLMENKDLWKLTLKCGWGLLWSSYVCAMLVILLLSAFVIGGITVNLVVKEPVRMKNTLNFDYTQKSPVAFVPIFAKHKSNQDIYIGEKFKIKETGSRVIPPHHKLQVTVSLTLPESVYNHNLGIFQVRVDFLDDAGNPIASSRRPCMLLYRSQPIHLFLTFLKLAPILTGYTSETQTLKINFQGFVERDIPTSGIRVSMEQRAEYQPGAGIPEIYDASLILESELPLLKRVLWLWRKTLFVWVSLTFFIWELVFALICCKPIIFPKIRLRQATDRDASRSGS